MADANNEFAAGGASREGSGPDGGHAMTTVAGRTAFITGGANGIGLGIARAFAQVGARLALVDLEADALAAAKAELSAVTQVETFVLDVRDRAAFAPMADAIEARLGPVSLVVNNAGVAGGAPAHKMTYALWDWGMGVNLVGVINGVQTFLPRMAERGGGGQIVNTASGAGLAASGSGVLYHTAKFAVVGLTEALRAELEPLGIGATVVCPGPVATDIIARTRALQPRDEPVDLAAGERDAAVARSATMTNWLANGVPPDEVGRMVLAAVLHNRLYVHTDRVMAGAIEARAKALLAAMPAAE
jgi:NAD(P)-dependent dehydrogenase (short-subunit alcohol dehydrogenase family)